MIADFADEVSEGCFGTTILHDGFPGVKFCVWLSKWLAVHTVALEGAGPGDVIYFDLPSHVFQLLKNPPDDEVQILNSLVLPPYLDSNAELESVPESALQNKECREDVIPASAPESFAPLVDSQDGFVPESAPLATTQGTVIPESLPEPTSAQPKKILATIIKATETKITMSLSPSKDSATQSEPNKKASLTATESTS